MDDVIKKIISLPFVFNSSIHKSVYDLLNESGYFELHMNVSEKIIGKYLEKYPECIDQWISYSEDKRCNSGYYLQKKEKKYIVGYMDDKNKKHMQENFDNEIEACASFIKREIESIRLLK